MTRTSNSSHKKTAIVEIQVGLSSRYIAKSIEHRSDGSRASSTIKWRSDGVEATKVRANCIDRTRTATGNLVSLQGLTDDHITDQLALRGCEIRRHVRRLNILLGRLAQFVKIPKWSWWNGRRAQSWHSGSRDKILDRGSLQISSSLTLEDL